MASYVAAYRIGTLVSGAGALFLVHAVEGIGLGRTSAWTAGYLVMAVLVVVGRDGNAVRDGAGAIGGRRGRAAAHANENFVARAA